MNPSQKVAYQFAVREYTLQPTAGVEEKPPFHYHKYIQAPFIISGRVRFENDKGEIAEVGPSDEVIIRLMTAPLKMNMEMKNHPQRIRIDRESEANHDLIL